MTGSMVDDFMTAAPTFCMSGVEEYMSAAPTTIGDLESSAPTLVRDRVANTEDFEDSDTAAEDDTELVFESESSEESSSESDSSEGYPAGPLLAPYRLSQVVRVPLWRGVPVFCSTGVMFPSVAVCVQSTLSASS